MTSFTINPNTLTPITPGSSASSTNSESTPGFTTEFSLEAPVSVLPPAISSFSVTSIVNPLENLGAIPNLGSVSDISAPGISAPGTVSTPSSGAGGITAPTDSSAGVPELPRIESPNGNVSSVVSPISSGEIVIKPAAYTYDGDGKCRDIYIPWFPDVKDTCTPGSTLEKKRDEEIKKANESTGKARDETLASAARYQAQLDLRKRFGNDQVADQQIGRMENSNFYNGLENNPRAKAEFWLGVVKQARSGKLTREKGWELVYVLERSAPVFDKTGRVVGYVEVPKGSKSKGYQQMEGGAFAPIGAAGVALGIGGLVAGALFFGSMAGIGDERYHMGMGILDGILETGQQLRSEIEEDDYADVEEKLTGKRAAKNTTKSISKAEKKETKKIREDCIDRNDPEGDDIMQEAHNINHQSGLKGSAGRGNSSPKESVRESVRQALRARGRDVPPGC